jgi:two-component sensor histidine kinase
MGSMEWKRAWRGEGYLSPVRVWIVMILCLAMATAFRWIISTLRPDTVPLTAYYPAVIIVAILGGLWPVAATVLFGALLGLCVQFGVPMDSHTSIVNISIYLLACSILIWGVMHHRSIACRYKDISDRLSSEEAYRKLVVTELEHRLKNKIATIHAVANQTLRNQPNVQEVLSARITALARTDELILRADGHGCDIAELLRLELSPYGFSRVTLNGEPLHLPAKLAVSLALIFHELATNAAKYGALVAPQGMLTVSWRQVGDSLSITWDETSVAPISAPTTEGFGTRLLNKALSPFEGNAHVDYLKTGMHCVLSCKILEI